MRERKEIEEDPANWEQLTLEVLLDIRDLLRPKGGRPVGSKDIKPRKKRKATKHE